MCWNAEAWLRECFAHLYVFVVTKTRRSFASVVTRAYTRTCVVHVVVQNIRFVLQHRARFDTAFVTQEAQPTISSAERVCCRYKTPAAGSHFQCVNATSMLCTPYYPKPSTRNPKSRKIRIKCGPGCCSLVQTALGLSNEYNLRVDGHVPRTP